MKGGTNTASLHPDRRYPTTRPRSITVAPARSFHLSTAAKYTLYRLSKHMDFDMSLPAPGIPAPNDFYYTLGPSASFHQLSLLPESINPQQTSMNTTISPNHVLEHGMTTSPPIADLLSNGECKQEPSIKEEAQEDRILQAGSRCKPAQSGAQKRKRAKQTMAHDKPAREIVHPKQVKGQVGTRKARKGYKATNEEEENDPDGEEKRRKFLERNKTAASKCRDKKKAYTAGLENKCHEGRQKNRILTDTLSMLQSEVVQLKEEALKHFFCDADIQMWLTNRLTPVQNGTLNENRLGQDADQEYDSQPDSVASEGGVDASSQIT